MIEIVSYQARWPGAFQQRGAALRQGLDSLPLRIDHIGSTSVPGLGAKDVIDVQVTVAALSPEEPLEAAFLAASRPLCPGLLEDHRPAGDQRPDAAWQKRLCPELTEGRRVHIHVRAAGSANQRYALLFRDYLRDCIEINSEAPPRPNLGEPQRINALLAVGPGSPNLGRRGISRQFLRADASSAGSYDCIKRELARLRPDDAAARYAVKDPACDLHGGGG